MAICAGSWLSKELIAIVNGDIGVGVIELDLSTVGWGVTND